MASLIRHFTVREGTCSVTLNRMGEYQNHEKTWVIHLFLTTRLSVNYLSSSLLGTNRISMISTN